MKTDSLKSFHKTNFGRFGESLPCDQEGYVHLTAEAWLKAPMDWGHIEGTEEEIAEYKEERCEEMAQEAIAATNEAEKALIDWQEANR